MHFGATVTVADAEGEREDLQDRRGRRKRSVRKGGVSFISPIGKALISTREKVTPSGIELPNGTIELEVLEIDYV